MPVFCIGQPISFEKINEFQEKWNIPMVIDAAGAIGCESENKKIGHIKMVFLQFHSMGIKHLLVVVEVHCLQMMKNYSN